MSSATSDEVINQVLQAEKNARQAVDLCRHRAALIITDGRERVRRILNRADERIAKVHLIADGMTEQSLIKINNSANLLSKPLEVDEKKLATIDKTVSLLVAELIGVNHDG